MKLTRAMDHKPVMPDTISAAPRKKTGSTPSRSKGLACLSTRYHTRTAVTPCSNQGESKYSTDHTSVCRAVPAAARSHHACISGPHQHSHQMRCSRLYGLSVESAAAAAAVQQAAAMNDLMRSGCSDSKLHYCSSMLGSDEPRPSIDAMSHPPAGRRRRSGCGDGAPQCRC